MTNYNDIAISGFSDFVQATDYFIVSIPSYVVHIALAVLSLVVIRLSFSIAIFIMKGSK